MIRKWAWAAPLLVVLALSLVPAPALAAKPEPFRASGTVSYITAGTVVPAGASGRYVVVEREIDGALSGDISGKFTMKYKANVELLTQAGDLHGTLKAGEAGETVLNVEGKIDPLTLVATPYGFLPNLSISGHWNFTSGAQGQGTFTAWVTFIPTPDGHVGWIVDSAFDLIGEWQP